MALEHHFYMDTTVSRHALRDTLVRAGIGFEARPDWNHTSNAVSVATNVTVRDDLSYGSVWPDNGVVATRDFIFRDRKSYLSKPETEGEIEHQSVLGIMALLKAYPEADAYWLAYDAALPVLLRRSGRLVLSQALAEPKRHWDPERQPYRALVDLPYTVAPRGPGRYVPVKAQEPGHKQPN